MIHNASIEQYREPVGAVTKGEEVKLRLFALGGNSCHCGTGLIFGRLP